MKEGVAYVVMKEDVAYGITYNERGCVLRKMIDDWLEFLS